MARLVLGPLARTRTAVAKNDSSHSIEGSVLLVSCRRGERENERMQTHLRRRTGGNGVQADRGCQTLYVRHAPGAVGGHRDAELRAAAPEPRRCRPRTRRSDGTKRQVREVEIHPVHESTRQALINYAAQRDRLCPNPGSPSFFLSEHGARVTVWAFDGQDASAATATATTTTTRSENSRRWWSSAHRPASRTVRWRCPQQPHSYPRVV